MNSTDRVRLFNDTDNIQDPENAQGILESSNAVGQADTQNSSQTTYTSQFASLVIIINVTIGAGILAMPYAVQTSGLISALIIQVFFLLGIVVTCIMMTELTVKTGQNSFHKVIQAHCHPFFYQLTQVSLLALVFGTAVAFIIIIGDQSDRIFASLYGSNFCHSWYLNRRFIMISTTLFLIKPLCSAKTVDFLKYGSFLGMLSIGFIVYVVTSGFIQQGHVAKDVNFFPKQWTDLGSILPVFCFAYQCHLSWVPTVATVRKEEKYTSYKTITIAMIIASIIYMAVTVMALLTFGASIQSDLTESYPGKSWSVLATVGIVAFKSVVTLPAAYLPARLCVVDILSSSWQRFADLSEPVRRISVTVITLNVALMMALFVPDILMAVNLLGCISVLFVFHLPALAYLHQTKENRLLKQQAAGDVSEVPKYTLKDQMKRATSVFFLVFGSIVMVLVLYKSIEKILNADSSVPLCVA